MRRIFYLIPDYRIKFNLMAFIRRIIKLDLAYINLLFRGADIPSGGIKVCFQHCELLNKFGCYARPLLLKNFKINWFKYTVRPVTITEVSYELNDEDIVVCPEVIPYEGLKFKKAKKIIFVQNWVFVTPQANILKTEDVNKNYLEFGYDNILTCGQFVTDYLYKNGKGEAKTITNGVDHSRFTYKKELKEENRILLLSRKNFEDAEKIVKLVKEQIPGVKFVAKDQLTENKIIEEYQKADIFLATGYPEGFPLPPLEAMACGCAVVGFTGGGGSEVMIDGETAMVAPDGNVAVAAQKVIVLLKNKELKEKIRRQGHEKSNEYTFERMKNELKRFYDI